MCQPGQGLARRGTEHDMARDLGVAQQARPALESLLGVVLGELLAARVELRRVADVGQRQREPGGAEHLAQGQRVVVVRGAVIGDDRGRSHERIILWEPGCIRIIRVDSDLPRSLATWRWP